jgi:hypothetical protein
MVRASRGTARSAAVPAPYVAGSVLPMQKLISIIS